MTGRQVTNCDWSSCFLFCFLFLSLCRRATADDGQLWAQNHRTTSGVRPSVFLAPGVWPSVLLAFSVCPARTGLWHEMKEKRTRRRGGVIAAGRRASVLVDSCWLSWRSGLAKLIQLGACFNALQLHERDQSRPVPEKKGTKGK